MEIWYYFLLIHDEVKSATNVEGATNILILLQRFKDSKSIEPGPGSYNDPRNALEATKRITGLKRSPFGQTALRFTKSASEAPREHPKVQLVGKRPMIGSLFLPSPFAKEGGFFTRYKIHLCLIVELVLFFWGGGQFVTR